MRKTFILAALIGMTLYSCRENIDDRAAREVKEFTEKNCPTPIINYTQTDSVTFERDSRTVHYYYKLCGKADNEEAINKNTEVLRETLLDAMRVDTQKKIYKEAGMGFRFTYRSESNPSKVLFDVTFTEKDYH